MNFKEINITFDYNFKIFNLELTLEPFSPTHLHILEVQLAHLDELFNGLIGGSLLFSGNGLRGLRELNKSVG